MNEDMAKTSRHPATRFVLKTALLLLLLLCKDSFGQNFTNLALDPEKAISQYSHDIWQTREGLPQNSVHAIVQTHDGYLWLGTQEGLARFDGIRFTVFDKRNTEELRHNHVLALFESSDSSLWIGTYGGGLSRLKDGIFTSYTTEDGLSNDIIRAICEDSDGSLWIGTSGGGVNRLKDGEFTTYSSKDGLSSDFIWSMLEARDSTLWLGTHGSGLNRLKDGKFKTYSTEDGLSNEMVMSIFEDRDGSLWIGTYDGRLYRFKGERFTRYKTKDGMYHNSVSSLYQTRDGCIWIGTVGGGLNRLKDGKITTYAAKDGLSNDRVISIYEDREGSLWVGTDGGGLNRFRDGKFTTYTTKDGLSHDMAWSIYEARDGSLWIGTDGGLCRFKGGEFTVYTTKDGLSNNNVRSIYEDGHGNLWIGTFGGGLNMFENGKFTIYTTRDGLSNDIVKAICEGTDGSLWIGTHGGGLSRLKDGTFTTYSTEDGLSNDMVRAIFESRDGSIWIGTDIGLNRLKDGELTTYTTKEGLSHNFVLSLHEDAGGSLWIGTHGGGLIRLKNGEFTSYTTREGLFNDAVFQILEDGEGNLWMSSNKGIFSVSKKELADFAQGKIKSITSISYGKADGMQSTECNGGSQPAGWKSRDGKLWFPTIKGVAMFDPENTRINRLPPLVAIERVVVDTQSIDPRKEIELSPGTSRFEFHYTGLSFLAPEKVRFKYKLEGLDTEWLDAGTRRIAYYTHIPPGSYKFRVIACNNDGIWNEGGASFGFYLQSYFYQTGIFYVFCILGFVLMGVGAFRLRVRQIRARERQLVLLVDERTKELHQEIIERKQAEEHRRQMEAKIQHAQKLESLGILAGGIAHDFNNLLVGILGNASLALMDLSPESPVRESLQDIEAAARRASELTNQMLAYSGKGKFIVERLNLSKLVEEIAHLLKSVISKKALLKYSFEKNLSSIEADPTQLRQVIMNLITNASEALGDKNGIITLRTGVMHTDRRYLSDLLPHNDLPEGKYVYLEVSDTGVGMDAETQVKIFDPFFTTKFTGRGLGMAAVLGIVRGHNGTIKIDSEPGRGTEIRVLFPCSDGQLGESFAEIHAGESRDIREWRGRGAILVVDDEKSVRDVSKKILERAGFTVLTAGDGREGVEIFRKHCGKIVAVLLDLTMPYMNGEEAFVEIRSSQPNACVLLSSGYTEKEAEKRFSEVGFVSFIQKPYKPNELIEKIRVLLQE